MKRYLCPKCGERYLTRGSKAQSGKVRWTCRNGIGDREMCYSTTDPTAPYRGRNAPKEVEAKQEFPGAVEKQIIVITWAQNATPLHKGFFRALLAYCKANGAQLIVIPGRYKNPTSRWEDSQVNAQWWAPELVPFLINQRTAINKNLVLLADIHVQPTAVLPLSGFESLTHGESGILGHPKLQMNVIPTPHQKLPKILTTTGAVTVANYTDTKAGKKGDFHHVLGAVVVELDGKTFHLRHVNARSDGAFCDLDKSYHSDGSSRVAGRYRAIVFGDTHVRFTDPAVGAASFGSDGLVERLDPETLVFHDLLDSYAVNPHHYGRPFIAVAKRKARYDNIHAEVIEACEWLAARIGKRQARVVASNHNDFLYRWMDAHDWRSDPENADFYLETALHMVRSAKIEAQGTSTADPFQFWASRLIQSPNFKCIGRRESLMIAGIECSLHGDQGPNGSRGSRANLSKIGAKTIIGHSHTPGITNGCYQAGTSTPLALEYTGSVGSWLNAHVSIDPMSKRHIHICVNGKFWR